MLNKMFALATVVLLAGLSIGCAHHKTKGTQIVVVGESFASGAEAAKEVNNFISNAAGSGCDAISVGGYGAGGEGLVIGVPVLLDCPQGTKLLPNGTPAP